MALVFLGVIAAGILTLMAAALLPQGRIDANILESAAVFEEEGSYPVIGDREATSTLDNYTDALILEEAAVMQAGDMGTIFSNPVYVKDDPAAEFTQFAKEREGKEPELYYVRYWQGFRAPVRLLLTFLNFTQIRQVNSFVFFALFAMAGLVIVMGETEGTGFLRFTASVKRKRPSPRFTFPRFGAGILFALSVIFAKPQVICHSLQLSCCFILAFIFILLVPWAKRKKIGPEFFLACGMITQFFDFYTTPLVTLGYPMIFWLLLTDEEESRGKAALKAAGAWLAGYGLMWIAKLALATVFTGVNGFADGFGSLANRTGIVKQEELVVYYNLGMMIRSLIGTCLENPFVSAAYLALIAVMAGRAVYAAVTERRGGASGRSAVPALQWIWLLLPAVMVMIWYCLSVQPTCIHMIFQYRTTAVTLWSVLMWLSMSGYRRNRPSGTLKGNEA